MAELLTTRLRLRPMAEDDLDAYAAICADPEVMRYIGARRPLTRDEAWRQIALFLGHWQIRGFGIWGIELIETGELIGRAGLWHPEGWPGLEAGWLLARSAWGNGYATEAAAASLEWAFVTLGVDRVISLIDPPNTASIRVAERLGEVREGTTDLFGREVFVYAKRRVGR